MNTTAKLFVLGLGFLAFSCESEHKEKEAPVLTEDTTAVEEPVKKDGPMEKDGITLSKVNSPLFAEATLNMEVPEEGATLKPGDNKFVFKVENYELGTQTQDADIKMCANSGKGQHIHFILDNEPYSAFYDTVFTKDISEGSHVLLAFVSRSYHESVKSESAYVLTKLKSGETEEDSVDLSAPHMFYSRPKGTYSGTDTEKVLLDFYLTNTTIEEDGNYVTVTINGSTSFDITSWEPYFMEGLPMGENTIKLELKDAEGNLIESPFNPVERTVTLEEGEKI